MRDELHAVLCRNFKGDDLAFSGPFELEHDRCHVVARIDGRADAQQLLRKLRFHHLKEAAQSLLVVVPGVRHVKSPICTKAKAMTIRRGLMARTETQLPPGWRQRSGPA